MKMVDCQMHSSTTNLAGKKMFTAPRPTENLRKMLATSGNNLQDGGRDQYLNKRT